MTFGEFIRARRKSAGIGLRDMAGRINASPAYVSQYERDLCPPPTEDKIRILAHILDYDLELLMAKAGRLPKDLSAIIQARPVEILALLRSVQHMDAYEIYALVRHVRGLGSP